uniref:DUF2804 domain-containing protein n=1 Tax=Acinetobacter nosocomialis TaxID=106654 RepID=UPI001C08DD59
LLAIGPVDGGRVHATQKTTALAVQGWAEADGWRLALDDAHAAVDASNGLLARDTAWRWPARTRRGWASICSRATLATRRMCCG